MLAKRIDRTQLSVHEMFELFPDDAAVGSSFIQIRWLDGIRCPRCDNDKVHKRRSIPPCHASADLAEVYPLSKPVR